jgi:hypothetical protein
MNILWWFNMKCIKLLPKQNSEEQSKGDTLCIWR